MKVNEVYSGTYIAVKNWPLAPEEHVIANVLVEPDTFNQQGGGRVLVLVFKGSEVKYRLNKTNAAKFVDAWGDDTDLWVGGKVTIHRTQATIRGQAGWAGNILPAANNKRSRKSA